MRPVNININIKFIYNLFGWHVSRIFKRWIDTNYKLIRATSQLHYLKNCKLNNLIPMHLFHLYKTPFTHKHYKTTHKLEKVIYNSQIKILNIEIFDLHRYIYTLNKELSNLSSELTNNLPTHLYNKTINIYSDRFYNYRHRLSIRYGERYLWLKHKNNANLFKKIKPIRYSYTSNENNDTNNIKFTVLDDTTKFDQSVGVNIEPNKFVDNTSDPLNHTNNKWFINLTNISIPNKVSNLLQLGGNFGLPIDKYSKKNAIHEFIKDIETHNRHITETEK